MDIEMFQVGDFIVSVWRDVNRDGYTVDVDFEFPDVPELSKTWHVECADIIEVGTVLICIRGALSLMVDGRMPIASIKS